MFIENSKTEQECIDLFHELFKDRDQLLKKLAPEGWEKSELFLVHHPTSQQRYEEALTIHNNLRNLFGRDKDASDNDPPKREDFQEDPLDLALIDPMQEWIEIWGRCLWDVFSNNHEVIDPSRTVYDIGSFRGAGGFIADYINCHVPEVKDRYGYLDFYMGTTIVSGRADLTPVYEIIFEKLKHLNCDWIYHFPRLYLIDLSNPDEELEAGKEENFLNYDPAESFVRQLDRQKKKEETSKLKEELDRIYEEAIEEAKDNPLPEIVFAYTNVYNRLPEGWPHI